MGMLIDRMADALEFSQTRWIHRQLWTINNNIFYCSSKLNGKNTKVVNESLCREFDVYVCAKFLWKNMSHLDLIEFVAIVECSQAIFGSCTLCTILFNVTVFGED